MANVLVEESSLSAVGSAIRGKNGTSMKYKPAEMAAAIEAITTGPDTSQDTVTADKVLSGVTFHDKDGNAGTGNIQTKTASDMTASGAEVTAPAGYYASAQKKSVATATQATPSISVNSSGLITATAEQGAGYVAAGTKTATQQLTTQAAATITPGTSQKTAVAAGRYTTGAVTVKGDANLVPENIKSGTSIFGVTGTVEQGGGFYPSIRVSATPGSTVTASKGSTTVTLTEIESGVYWGEVTDYGAWTLSTGDVIEVEAVEQYVIKKLNDYTWDEISAISQAGTGADYFAIGDTKAITLNGTVGTKAYSNVTLYIFIAHFNLPVNGTADNNIIWHGFKTAATNGTDVALNDGNYDTSGDMSGKLWFTMNHWGNYNYGGWISCDMRYDILGAVETAPSGYGSAKTTSATGSNATQKAITNPVANTLMAALPSDFRNALRLWTRWLDAVGNSSNTDANVKAIVDAGISLLAEFEIHGSRKFTNQYEQNHQKQLDYYKNGNSKIKYCQSKTSIGARWWCSSTCYYDEVRFCYVDIDGTASNRDPKYVNELAPAFKT